MNWLQVVIQHADRMLGVFLSIQVALVVSWFFLKFFRSYFLGGLRHRTWLRIAQCILVISILGPTVIYLPQFQTHVFSWREAPQLMESYGRRVVFHHDHQVHSIEPSFQAVDPEVHSESNAWLELRDVFTWNNFFLLLIGLSIVFTLIQGFLQMRRLVHVLRKTTPIHSFKRITVAVSSQITIPFSTSLGLRSWVVLPLDLINQRTDFNAALVHELQHIRQGDTRFTVLIDLFGSVFSPAMLVWKNIIIELQEFSCDEALIGQSKVSLLDYGSCLVRVAEAALRKGSLRVGTTCMASNPENPKRFKSFLRRRVEMLVEHQQFRPKSQSGRMIGIGLVVGCILISLVAGASLKPSALPPLNAGSASFDPAVEKIAKEVLTAAMKKNEAKSAFAVIADPITGRVIAAVSVGELKEAPISHLIEPASTLKTLIFAEGIENHQFTANDHFDGANGNYKVGNRVHHDWKPFGDITARKIVTSSSNIGGIRLAEKLGVSGIQKMWSDFGFGAKGSVRDFPGARVGYLSPADQGTAQDQMQWLPHIASGLETLYISPLEMVQAYSAIANGGKLMKAISNTSSDSEIEVIRRVLSAENAKLVQDVLVEAATAGTGARRGLSEHYSSAGKTGTSYDPKLKEHEAVFGGDESVAHYVGFAPLNQPRVTIYIAVMGTKAPPTGSYNAAPVFKAMIDRVLPQLKVAPDLKI